MKEIKENAWALVLITSLNFIVLWNFISYGQLKHGLGYFIFFYVSIVAIHFITKIRPSKIEVEIKQPKKEFIVACIFALMGGMFLTLNFMLKANLLPNMALTRIPIILGSIIFAMPLGIFVYLLLKKYSIMKLGLNIKPLSHVFIGLFIWALTGLFAYVFFKSGMLWEAGYEELGGVTGIILQGIIGAALFEEFSRFVIQSRFEKLFNIAGINILFATTIWAFMHFPVTYFKGSSTSETLMYCIQIIPIGCVWGYLTQKTKSIIPSTFAHGLNLWGFQNS